MGACRVRVHSWLLRRDVFFTYPTVLKWPDWGKEIVSLVGEGPTRVVFVTSPVPACRSCGAGNSSPEPERPVGRLTTYPHYGLIYP